MINYGVFLPESVFSLANPGGSAPAVHYFSSGQTVYGSARVLMGQDTFPHKVSKIGLG